jgi:hypothetical protein
MAVEEARHLVVGRLRKPHGLKGDCAVFLPTDELMEVFAPGRSVWVKTGRSGGRGSARIERSRPPPRWRWRSDHLRIGPEVWGTSWRKPGGARAPHALADSGRTWTRWGCEPGAELPAD